MKKRQILWAIVFGSLLAITGCGDSGSSDSGDGGSGGSGGSGGTGGTGGSGGSNGGGGADSTCEAFCGSSCIIMGNDPGDDFAACVQGCSAVPEWERCGPEAQSFVDCLEANDCNEATQNCNNQALAWTRCIAGFDLPI